MLNSTIWVVVRYPQTVKPFHNTSFHIYAKSTSNKAKMIEYYKELKARHKETGDIIRLVPREEAERLHKAWRKYIKIVDSTIIENYKRRNGFK